MVKEEWLVEFMRNLRVHMRRKRWTQAKLAKEAGISEVTISRYINGERIPDSYMLYKLAKALDCRADDLINYQDN